jgi:uncharacterized cupredoxin-like copper-binding protein
MRRTSRLAGLIAALSALTLLVSACGGEEHGDGHEAATSVAGTIPGAPADAADADREIQIQTLDQLAFDPESVEVEAGETITFVIENTGEIDHEFVLGDEAYQAEHADEMSGGEHGGGHGSELENAIEVEPGETAELTWTFEEEAELLFGCHEPGHYDGGMVGAISVT